MTISTCDVYDRFEDTARVPLTTFTSFGGRSNCSGQVVTVKCFEDNSRIREVLGTEGKGKVLVVDGGESRRCALLGDMIAKEAVRNAWEGIVVFGCVRDRTELQKLDIAVFALATTPRKSVRRGEGTAHIPLNVGGIVISETDTIVADEDGLVVLEAGQLQA